LGALIFWPEPLFAFSLRAGKIIVARHVFHREKGLDRPPAVGNATDDRPGDGDHACRREMITALIENNADVSPVG
jgi:hypothetical protein